jgi:hypothetical protein
MNDMQDDFISRTIRSVDGYLQAEKWDAEARDIRSMDELSQDEQDWYGRALDAEYDQYWSAHCVKHGTGLLPDGHCVECDVELAEERIADH